VEDVAVPRASGPALPEEDPTGREPDPGGAEDDPPLVNGAWDGATEVTVTPGDGGVVVAGACVVVEDGVTGDPQMAA